MASRIIIVLAASLAFLPARVLHAQGVLRDGTDEARFEFVDSGTEGLANFQADGLASEDHIFRTWWWYRVDGESHEEEFEWPAPSEQYIGNSGLFRWSESDFDARLALVLREGVIPGEATLATGLSITNTTSAVLTINLFNYADFDVGASTENSAVLVENGRMMITDDLSPTSAEFLAIEPLAYQVTTFEDLREQLDDEFVTDLDDTGLPLNSNDFTGAFQWMLTIPPGETRTVRVGLSINSPAVAGPIVVPVGACPGEVTIEVHGATPHGDVSILYGVNRGPWTAPNSGCSGEAFFVAPPFLPGAPLTLTADEYGVVRATSPVRESLCGRLIVQAIDQTTCFTSNPVGL